MLKLAWRNLTSEHTRLFISAGGVALAILLIFVMQGVFAGSEEHAVVYIQKQPAALWMMQAGVENLHMSTSLLLPDVLQKVRAVPGVKDAVGVLYLSSGIDFGEEVVYTYLFGIDPGIPFGGPWKVKEGSDDLEHDEIVIDQELAKRYRVSLGDQVQVYGKSLTIRGISDETLGIATSISFINRDTLSGMMGVPPGSSSYILIQPEDGAVDLAGRLKEAVPDSNLLDQSAFIESDRMMIRQMGADVIRAISIVAYIVGMLVIGLTIYTMTLERSREYGVLKALGAGAGILVRVVLAQAYFSAWLGFATGVGLAFGVSILVLRIFPEMLILIRPSAILWQIPAVAALTTLAALLPLARIFRIDPLIVFRS